MCLSKVTNEIPVTITKHLAGILEPITPLVARWATPWMNHNEYNCII